MMPSLALLVAAGILAPPAPVHPETWDCKILAASNPAITMQEGRFEVMGNQLFGHDCPAWCFDCLAGYVADAGGFGGSRIAAPLNPGPRSVRPARAILLSGLLGAARGNQR